MCGLDNFTPFTFLAAKFFFFVENMTELNFRGKKSKFNSSFFRELFHKIIVCNIVVKNPFGCMSSLFQSLHNVTH
jgi:hypothetical protein